MITYVYGDLFESPAKVLVNAVNTVGVMGAGIAADFKSHYPEMFEHYRQLCVERQFRIGQLWLYQTPHKWVLNFPTKRHWRAESRLEDIEAGLQKFVSTYAEKGITSASFPMLGTGTGGLDWDDQVRPLMESYLRPLAIMVYVHDLKGDARFAERRHPRAVRAWLNGQPQPLAFIKVWRDLVRAVTEQDRYQTLDEGRDFRVVVDDSKRRSVTIYAPGGSIFLPETMLGDLWVYIHSAGYALPHNLPGGLDEHAPYLFTLLAALPYLRPALLSLDGEQRHVGLHLIPPIDRRAAQTAKVTEGD